MTRSALRIIRVTLLLWGFAAGCSSSPAVDRDAGAGRDARSGANGAAPAAVVLSAGGSLRSPSFRLEVQVGQGWVPRHTTAGATRLEPRNPIAR